MTELTTNESQSSNSPAKQMLAALTRASQDMTKTVHDVCEHVEQLNYALELKVNERLEEANSYAEFVIRGQLSGISSEKDGILAELSELRREELKELHGIGRKIRESMASRFEAMIGAINKELEEKLLAFSEKLSDTEKSTEDQVNKALQNFRKQLPDHRAAIQKKTEEEKSSLGDLQNQHKEFFELEIVQSTKKLIEEYESALDALKKQAEKNKSELDEKCNSILQENNDKSEELKKSFTDMLNEAKNRVSSMTKQDHSYLNEMEGPFTAACKHAADLSDKFHATQVENLALEYKNEFFLCSKEAEDRILNARSEIQTELNSQRQKFSEQADKLFLKFEKTLREIPIKNESKQKGGEDSAAQVRKILDELRQRIAATAEEKLAESQELINKSFEELSLQMSSSGRKVSEQMEQSFAQAQEDASRAQSENRKYYDQLLEKIQALELLADESRELISALGDAGLEFEG